jgi:hypothetical protein
VPPSPVPLVNRSAAITILDFLFSSVKVFESLRVTPPLNFVSYPRRSPRDVLDFLMTQVRFHLRSMEIIKSLSCGRLELVRYRLRDQDQEPQQTE